MKSHDAARAAGQRDPPGPTLTAASGSHAGVRARFADGRAHREFDTWTICDFRTPSPDRLGRFFADLMVTLSEDGVGGDDAADAVRALWQSRTPGDAAASPELDAATLVHGIGAVAVALAEEVVAARRAAGSHRRHRHRRLARGRACPRARAAARHRDRQRRHRPALTVQGTGCVRDHRAPQALIPVG